MTNPFRLTRFAVVLAALAVTAPAWSLSDADSARIAQAVPAQATAKVKKPRKVLVYSQALGFKHASIPFAEKALEEMAKSTKAYTVDISDDPSVFTPENLKKYDAIVLNNNTGEWLTTPTLRQALLDFVSSGKGLVGIHAASDGNYTWPEFGKLIGGYFENHPWTSKDTVTLKLNRPKHPVVKAFVDRPLEINDEIYQIKDPYSADAVLELISLDTAKTDMNKKGITRTDGDFPVAWVHRYGKGRVFYTSLGHNEHLYSNPMILQHYLDGLQFVLGDLKGSAKPAGAPKAKGKKGKKAEKANGVQKAEQALATAAATTAAATPTPAPSPTPAPASDTTTGTAAQPSDEEIQKAIDQLKNFDFGKDHTFLRTLDAGLRASSAGSPERDALLDLLSQTALDDKLTFAARDEALRRLGAVAPASMATVLKDLLASKDPKLAQSAVRAITNMPGDEADQALISALGTTSGIARIGIINGLGQRRAAKAVPALTKIAVEGDQAQIMAAVTSLGKIGTADAGKALLDKVRPPDAVRAAWFAALNNAAAQLGPEDAGLAGRLYDHVLQMAGDNPARLAAFKGKAELDENPEETALKALDDGATGGLAEVARQILVRGKNPAVAAQLTERLKNASAEAQITVVEILGARGDKAALDDITSIAAHTTPQAPGLQTAAIEALQGLGDQHSVPTLLKVAAEQKGAPAKAAVRTLVEMRVPEVDDELQRLINEGSNSQEQVIAIEAALERKSDGLVQPLLEAAKSPSDRVATAAFKALSQTASPANLPELLQIHDGIRSARVLKEASRTITAVARASKSPADVITQLHGAFQSASDPLVKASLLNVLGRVGGDKALVILREYAGSTDEMLRDAAIRALSEFPTPNALEDLMTISSQGKSGVHKVLAMRGVTRLLAKAENAADALTKAKKILVVAPGKEEKKAVIGAIADLKTTGVLETLLPLMDERDLKDEAIVAILKHAPIAHLIDPGKTAELLNPLSKRLSTDQWNELEEILTPEAPAAGAIRAFEISKMYGKKDAEGPEVTLEKAFTPETAPGAGDWEGIFWAGTDEDGDKAGKGDLLARYPGSKNVVVYLRAYIWAPEDRQVELRTGSDDGMKVWLNDQPVLTTPANRSFAWDADKTKIQLKRGWNPLMFKITQGTNQWTVAARLVNLDGKPMSDIKYSAVKQ